MSVQHTTLELIDQEASALPYAVELTSLDPSLAERDLDLFHRLSAEERTRIIIRVLCGLVAMGEADDQERLDDARALPSLGLEDARRRPSTRPRGWNTALLPFLGRERAF